jgi:hypothetical protein
MIERFTSPSGAATLKDAMMQQRVIQHDDAVAQKFIDVGTQP